MVPHGPDLDLERLRERVRRLGPAGRPAAVVMNAHITGLAVARSLNRRGVSVVALDHHPGGVALYSRHVAAAGFCPNPLADEPGLVEFLWELGEAFETPPVLFGCMDEWVLAVARNHELLARRYRIPFPDAHGVEAVLDKARLYERARAAGVPVPRTAEVEPDPEAALDAAGWPVLLKPRDKRGFYDFFGRALFAPQSRDEYRQQVKVGRPFGLLAQEQVPVSEGGHVTLAAYVDTSGRVAADLVGRRLAIYPPGSGTTCLVEVAAVEEVRAHGRRLLETLGYHGIAEVEFLRDRRDGSYRLIDLNTRPWKWIGLPVAAGVDLPWLAYAEAAGPAPAGEAPPPINGRRWVYLRDYLTLLRETGGASDRLSRREREAVLRGDPEAGVVEAVWDPADPGPAWRLVQNEVGARKYYCPC